MCNCKKHLKHLKDACLYSNWKSYTYFIDDPFTEIKCFALTLTTLVRSDPYVSHSLPNTYCINNEYFCLQNGRSFNAEWVITPNIEVGIINNT
ncbi:NS6 protein [Night heron coronavirus HKU19]|uniref:NS6 protein n=2 Tax=Deltacoronavirus TaxID=1159901 RepID=H9BR20_9NIDO|nr:NS6 gene product [Night heron coronavirus HKU19]AFD29229.1 NS6 protein [Night heron coronavirus HKU19]